MSPLPERQALAAEYVCGILDPATEREADQLMRQDPEFGRTVQQWRERLAGFDDSVDARPPSDSLWQRIETGLASRSTAPAPRASRFAGWWDNTSLWRATAIGAVASTVLLAAALVFQANLDKPVMVAVLIDGDRAGAVVHVFDDGRAVLLPLTDIAVPADRALQVWTLPSRERGPVSVGLMQRAQTLPLELRDLPVTRTDQLFEITLEPKGGSPIGRPTGPILFKGLAARTL